MQGDWQWGKRHGFGRMMFPDGSRYMGDWVDDRVHGQGEHVYANGNKYNGEWLDGRFIYYVCASMCICNLYVWM